MNSAANPETQADILAEMREAAKSTDLFNGEEVGEPLIRGTKVEDWADRIEAAAKRAHDIAAALLAVKGVMSPHPDPEHAPGSRNCDVGTDEEQWDRFTKFCMSHLACITCPVKSLWNFENGRKPSCGLIWAQMPYDKEESNE